MRKAIVVGSGAGGAVAAKELQGKYEVTLLEAGKAFHPFNMNLDLTDKIKKAGLLRDEREIQWLFPAMRIRKTSDGMVMVNGVGLGGTTTLATGNGIRQAHHLKELGINLDQEFAELDQEVPISIDHQQRWRPATKKLYAVCQEMNLHPVPLPKMGDYRKCVNCGRCVLGCDHGAKWDSRKFLQAAENKGARTLTGALVKKVKISAGKATGVVVHKWLHDEFLPADLVVLAAGGFGTPVILENSGIRCEPRLFVDPVLCVATRWENAWQNHELSMPFVVQKDGFILSPYFDYLSYFFNKSWKLAGPDTLALMIKLADVAQGSVSGNTIHKTLQERDKEKLRTAVELVMEIFNRVGIKREQTFLGTINAGHPGGMLPLTKDDAATLHPQALAENLYVADATLLPCSLGNPPILTIMALAKKICKSCC